MESDQPSGGWSLRGNASASSPSPSRRVSQSSSVPSFLLMRDLREREKKCGKPRRGNFRVTTPGVPRCGTECVQADMSCTVHDPRDEAQSAQILSAVSSRRWYSREETTKRAQVVIRRRGERKGSTSSRGIIYLVRRVLLKDFIRLLRMWIHCYKDNELHSQ